MNQLSITTALARVEDQVKTRGLFPGAALEHAKMRLAELCDSVIIVRSPKRDENGKCIYVEVPNDPIRLAAAVKLIELETGKAPQAIDVTTRNPTGRAPTAVETLEILRKNPALASKIFDHIIGAAKMVKEASPSAAYVIPSESKPESESGGLAR